MPGVMGFRGLRGAAWCAMLIGQCVPTIAQASGGTWMIGCRHAGPR
jgi:hypothetical protein